MASLDTHEAQPQKGLFYGSDMTYMSVHSALGAVQCAEFLLGKKSVSLRINVIWDDKRNIKNGVSYLSLCRSI